MSQELKVFAIKFGVTLLLTPLIGWVTLVNLEKFEQVWKTNNRRKKWLASCVAFLVLAAISGWFL